MGIHLAALEEIQKDNIIGPYLLHDIVTRSLIQKLVSPHSTGTLQLNSANVMVKFLKKEALCSSVQTSVLFRLYLLMLMHSLWKIHYQNSGPLVTQ